VICFTDWYQIVAAQEGKFPYSTSATEVAGAVASEDCDRVEGTDTAVVAKPSMAVYLARAEQVSKSRGYRVGKKRGSIGWWR
jgi:hypothetical protein